MTLATLRDRALSPALFADAVPEGVLARLGFACWEQPDSVTGGGYMHWLHQVNMVEYDLYLNAAIRNLPGVMTAADLTALRDIMINSPIGYMQLNDLDPGGIYDSGTSLMLQQTVFAPVQATQAAAPSNYDYQPDLDLIRTHWTKSLFIQIGVANNELFYTGSLHYNNDFPLQCRAAENQYRPYVDSTTYEIAATDWLSPINQFGLDSITRLWPRTVYDPTVPAVFALIQAHIQGLIATYGTNVHYVVHGEASLASHGPATTEVATNFSADRVVGFRRYMEFVLGLTIAQANARWGTAYAAYANVDPSVAPFGALDEQMADWNAYQSYIIAEMATEELTTAFTANANIEATVMRFGPGGLERSWLEARFGSVGDWIGDLTDDYIRRHLFALRDVACAARLSGTPTAFPITSPPHVFDPTPAGQESLPPIYRSYWRYTTREWGFILNDLMACNAIHFGYLKCPQVGFGADLVSVSSLRETLEAIEDAHLSTYARTGPYQRFAIEAGDTMEDAVDEGSGAGPTLHRLAELMRHNLWVEPAIFQSLRVRNRTLARNRLARSLVQVLFPPALVATKDDYVDLFPENAPGAAVIVAYSTGGPPAWVAPAPLALTWYGTLYRVLDGATPTNVFYFDCRLIGQCDRGLFFEGVARVLYQSVYPVVTPFIGTADSMPFSLLPFTIDADRPLEITTNFTTDGVNFSVMLSNLSAAAQPVTVTVNSAVATALDVTYDPQTITLGGFETRTVRLDAEFSGIDLAAAIPDAQAKLAALAGYDTAAGTTLLTQANTLRLTDPGRSLAAYIAAVRMVYLNCTFAAPNITVNARRITILGGGAAENPDGARVQVMFPRWGREEQAAEGTIAGGAAVIALGAPVGQRWLVASNNLAAPPAAANDTVEIHVTDARGSSTRFRLATP